MYDDRNLDIKWPFDRIGGIENMIISDKDKSLMSFDDYTKLVSTNQAQ